MLLLAVHLDAFWLAPGDYLAALWWRLLGKRLRARNRLEPLLGKSPRAYRLWIQRRESVCRSANRVEKGPPIIALVDGSAGYERASETVQNLEKQGLPALVIGGQNIPNLAEAARHIDWTAQPWLMPLAAGDRISTDATHIYRAAVTGVTSKIAYADDDLLDQDGRRSAPHFKPAWNRELFRYFDYLSGACIIRASPELLEKLPGDGWMRQLTRLIAVNNAPIHVPYILHHRRSRPKPQLPSSIDVHGEVPASVSVIIPTRNRLDLLRPCLEGLSRTSYPNLDIIVVDNGSDDPATLAYLADLKSQGCTVISHPGRFNFSAINNRAVGEARGEFLCFLNNDVEVIDPDWLWTMVAQARRDDVGAVGAQLLYPDGRIQHAGVMLGICGGAAHAHRFLRLGDEGYFKRHLLPQFVSAVTAACLVVRRDRFLAVGGFDERNFAVAFNDVDICMKLNGRGWQSLYEPRAKLIHHESVSRGKDREPAQAARLARELDALARLWGSNEKVDPYHHPELSPYSEKFVVRL